MACQEVFLCSVCGEQKQSTNHWQVLFSGPSMFLLLPWSDRIARNPKAQHIHGHECAAIAQQRWMDGSKAN